MGGENASFWTVYLVKQIEMAYWQRKWRVDWVSSALASRKGLERTMRSNPLHDGNDRRPWPLVSQVSSRSGNKTHTGPGSFSSPGLYQCPGIGEDCNCWSVSGTGRNLWRLSRIDTAISMDWPTRLFALGLREGGRWGGKGHSELKKQKETEIKFCSSCFWLCS